MQSFVAIGGSLALLTNVVACGILAAYIAALNAQSAVALSKTPALLAAYRVRDRDAAAAMRALIAQADFKSLRFWAVNDTMRVAVVRDGFAHAPVLHNLPRTETEFAPRPFKTRLAVAAGTAFGLQLRRARVAQMYIYITTDEDTFERTLFNGCCVLLLLLGGISLYGWLAARSLTRKALQPLTEVASALEAFAACDFRSRPVDASASDGELRRLAIAVNSAMAQVTRALRERDEAHSQIRRFIADAAHQLRTPLTVIQGFASIMGTTSSESPQDRARIVSSIDKQTRVMADLVSKLTLLDRWDGEVVRSEIIHVGEFVRDVALPFIAANPGREIALSSESNAYVRCDPRELEEALSNVIDNALKYGAPESVTIAIEASATEIAIVVHDAGSGMSETECLHAFDRFYRGDKRDIVGSGLGLSIAQRVVERVGGRVTLASTREFGTTVMLMLPRAPSPSNSLVFG